MALGPVTAVALVMVRPMEAVSVALGAVTAVSVVAVRLIEVVSVASGPGTTVLVVSGPWASDNPAGGDGEAGGGGFMALGPWATIAWVTVRPVEVC